VRILRFQLQECSEEEVNDKAHATVGDWEYDLFFTCDWIAVLHPLYSKPLTHDSLQAAV
jgi:hypothetical protein